MTLTVTLMLSLTLISCAKNHSYYSDKRQLPGGGPLAKVSAEDTFKFVVVGDTRSGHDVFKKEMQEIELFDPDMVIDLGDMIDGYKDTAPEIEAMWDEFDQINSEFNVPFVMVAGNHDIWSHLSESIYKKRYGKLYYSFDHKGAHFIVLDTEVLDSKGHLIHRIDNEQLEWLKADLASSRDARATFVFLHKPYWRGKAYAVNEKAKGYWFKDVHPILAKNGVDAVFAGHIHKYLKTPTLDGVSYYIVGGGGAKIWDKNPGPKNGDIFSYCLVTIRADKWKLAVVKPGSIYPDDFAQVKE